MKRVFSFIGAMLAVLLVFPGTALAVSPEEEVENRVYSADGDWEMSRDIMPGEKLRCLARAEVTGGREYVLRCHISDGLCFDSLAALRCGDVPVNASYYTLVTGRLQPDCAFEIHLSESFAPPGDNTLTVEYTLRRNDGTDTDPEWLSVTVEDDRGQILSGERAEAGSFSLCLYRAVAVPDGEKQGNPLSGACFSLYRDSAMQNRVAFREQGGSVYQACRGGECGHTRHAYILRTGGNGRLDLRGLTAGTYYLRETRPPQGYSSTAEAMEIRVTETGEIVAGGELLSDGVVRLVEQRGAPETEKKPALLEFYEKGCRVMAAALTILVLSRQFLL